MKFRLLIKLWHLDWSCVAIAVTEQDGERAININLTDEETTLLTGILKNALSDMKEETGKTENYDWRVALKKDEASLRSIISRLETGVANRWPAGHAWIVAAARSSRRPRSTSSTPSPNRRCHGQWLLRSTELGARRRRRALRPPNAGLKALEESGYRRASRDREAGNAALPALLLL